MIVLNRKVGALALALLASAGFAGNSVQAEDKKLNIAVVGLADFYTPSVDTVTSQNLTSLTSSSKLGFGGGVLVDGGFVAPFGMETGLLFVHRGNQVVNTTVTYNQSSNWLIVPVGLKLRLIDVLSVGAGAYAGYRISDYSNDFTVGNSGAAGFNSASGERWELGFYASAGVNLPVTQQFGVLLEARYLRGVSTISEDTNVNIKSADVMVLAGLTFRY